MPTPRPPSSTRRTPQHTQPHSAHLQQTTGGFLSAAAASSPFFQQQQQRPQTANAASHSSSSSYHNHSQQQHYPPQLQSNVASLVYGSNALPAASGYNDDVDHLQLFRSLHQSSHIGDGPITQKRKCTPPTRPSTAHSSTSHHTSTRVDRLLHTRDAFLSRDMQRLTTLPLTFLRAHESAHETAVVEAIDTERRLLEREVEQLHHLSTQQDKLRYEAMQTSHAQAHHLTDIISTLSHTRKQAEERHQHMQEQYKKEAFSLREVTQQYTTLSTTHQQLHEESKEQSSELSTLKEQYTLLHHRFTKLQSYIDVTYTPKMREYEQEREEMKLSLTQAQSDLITAQSSTQSLVQQIEAHEKEVLKYKDLYQSTHHLVSGLQSELAESKSAHKAILSSHSTLETSSVLLRKQYTESQLKFDGIDTVLEGKCKELDMTQKKYEQLKIEHEKLIEMNAEERKQAKFKVDQLQLELNQSIALHSPCDSRITTLTQHVEKLEKELSQSKSSYDRLVISSKMKQDSLQAVILKHESDLAKVHSDNTTLTAKVEKMKNKNRLLIARIETEQALIRQEAKEENERVQREIEVLTTQALEGVKMSSSNHNNGFASALVSPASKSSSSYPQKGILINRSVVVPTVTTSTTNSSGANSTRSSPPITPKTSVTPIKGSTPRGHSRTPSFTAVSSSNNNSATPNPVFSPPIASSGSTPIPSRSPSIRSILVPHSPAYGNTTSSSTGSSGVTVHHNGGIITNQFGVHLTAGRSKAFALQLLLDSAHHSIATLHEQLSSLVIEMKDVKRRKVKLTNELKESKMSIEIIQKENEELRECAEELRAQKVVMEEIAVEKHEQVEKEKAELLAEIKSTNERITALEAQLVQSTQALTTQQTQSSENIQSQQLSYESQLTSLRAELEQAHLVSVDDNTRVAETQSEKEVIQAKCIALEEESARAKADHSAQEVISSQTILDLRAELASHTTKLQSHHIIWRSLRLQCGGLQMRIKQREEQIVGLRNEAAKKAQELIKEKEGMLTQIHTYKEKLLQTMQQSRGYQDEIRKMHSDLLLQKQSNKLMKELMEVAQKKYDELLVRRLKDAQDEREAEEIEEAQQQHEHGAPLLTISEDQEETAPSMNE